MARCTNFLKGRGEKKGTLARVLAPKRAVYHVLTSQGGSLVCFANQEGTLARFFGSQEGTLARVFQQFGHEEGRLTPLLLHITGHGPRKTHSWLLACEWLSLEGTVSVWPIPPPSYSDIYCSLLHQRGASRTEARRVTTISNMCRVTDWQYYISRIRTGGFSYDAWTYSIRFWRKGSISANCSYWIHLKKIVLLIKYWKSQDLLEAPDGACWIYQHLTQTMITSPPHTQHYLNLSPPNRFSLSESGLFLPNQHPLPPHTAFAFP